MRDDIKYGNEATVCHIGEKLGIQMSQDENLDHYRERIIGFIERQEGGGPAFGEFHKAGECEVKQGGMTLRDYFAAKAVNGLCSNSVWLQESFNHVGDECINVVAKAAYELADAMLVERAK